MEKITEQKTIIGVITKISAPQLFGTCWREFLFKGRKALVRVRGSTGSPSTMYIREDSWVGLMKIPIDQLLNTPLMLTIHGEIITGNEGCLFIDRIAPELQVIKTTNISNYFDID